MAIYRTGQASMDAQGYITGYDTKWREQLTLIRPGATIFFIDAPFQAAVISEVISDTQIRAITTGGAEIGRSNYIILLHDSITVDGLAQDVAETLRYYQSKETQIEEAIEFFKNFDLKQLQDLASQVKGDAEKTADDRAATEQLKNDTQQVKDSAVAETNQIKSDTDAIKEQTQQIKDLAVTETEAIKQEAFGARDQAELARDAAGNHAVDANNAKAGAETARDEARQWAQQVNPENLLHKDQNLNDVQDKGAARAALDVPAKSESFLIENNLSEIADRAAAWLNVRPIGSTPLAADPLDDLDATTKQWVVNHVLTTVGDGYNAISDSWTVSHNDEVAPEIGAAVKGGEIRSDYNIGGSMHIRSSMRADGNYGQRGGGVWRIEDFHGKSNEIQFNMDTNVIFPVPIVTDGMNVIARSIQSPDGTWPTGSPWVGCQLTGRVPNSGFDGAQFNMYVQENVGVDSFGGLLFIGANTTQAWLFNQFGNAIAPGSWVSNSDRRIKKDIARIEDPLDKMRKIHGYSWRKLEGNQFGVGFIAQEVQELFPEAVYEGPSRTMPDGTVVEGVLSPDTSGVAAALHHEAILALMDQIEELKKEIAELKK